MSIAVDSRTDALVVVDVQRDFCPGGALAVPHGDDVVPAGSANLSQLVPPWAHEGGPRAMLDRFGDPTLRARILREIVHGAPDWNNFFRFDWEDIRLAYVHADRNRWMQGLSVAEAARRLGRDPGEVVLDVIHADDNRTMMVNFVMADEDVEFLLPQPESIIKSDGWSTTPERSDGRRPSPPALLWNVSARACPLCAGKTTALAGASRPQDDREAGAEAPPGTPARTAGFA